jgi:lipid-A-disaccharide synthase
VADADALAVMGLVEVLRHLPRLLRLRARLRKRWLDDPPDVFVGIDAPDFNLGLESALRAGGVRTVHYVSPSVWAWRPGRVHVVGRAAHRVLALFPFEPALYAAHGYDARFVGHPAADALSPDADRVAARRALALDADARWLAVLPGSRAGELERIGPAFAGAIGRLAAARPALRFVAPMAQASLGGAFRRHLAAAAPGVEVRLVEGRSREALAACDLALVASGTATLEAMLLGRPMVVGYRVAALTHFIVRTLGLVKLERFALPNILAGAPLVPELLQAECTGERLARAALGLLDDAAARERQVGAFRRLHGELAQGADERAARAVVELLGAGPASAGGRR